MTGGYKIIDLTGLPITVGSATGTTVSGIYESIEGSYKPILIEGLVLVDSENVETEIKPFFADFVSSSGAFTATFNLGFSAGAEGYTVHNGYTITIDDDNAVIVKSWSITATTTA